MKGRILSVLASELADVFLAVGDTVEMTKDAALVKKNASLRFERLFLVHDLMRFLFFCVSLQAHNKITDSYVTKGRRNAF